MRVALFIPCFVDVLAPSVGLATARLLARLGYDVVYPADQTCCGQPALNAGRTDDASALASRLLRVLDAADPDFVVAPSGSCVAALTTEGIPGYLATDDEACGRLYELTAFLVARGHEDVGARFRGRVTWHDACHPLRELGIRDGPRRLLRAVEDLELVEMSPSEECCGFGGTFAVQAPAVSAAMGRRKLRAIEAARVTHVASTEPSCLMQIEGLLRRRRSRVRTVHVAEILAATGRTS